MESIVHQSLGNIINGSSRPLRDISQVNDALVRDVAVDSFVQNREMWI